MPPNINQLSNFYPLGLIIADELLGGWPMPKHEHKGILHYSAPHHDKIYDETHLFIKRIARKANLPTEACRKLVRVLSKDITQRLPSKSSLKFRQLLPEGLRRECETLELATPDSTINAQKIIEHLAKSTKATARTNNFPRLFWEQIKMRNTSNKTTSLDHFFKQLPTDLRKLLSH